MKKKIHSSHITLTALCASLLLTTVGCSLHQPYNVMSYSPAHYTGVAMPIVVEADNSTTDDYDFIQENSYKHVSAEPLSTFSIDVDTASYSNTRQYINMNQLPPKGAVRIEEMINYFTYDYPQPGDQHPFSVTTETAECPWNRQNRIVHIGIQGKELNHSEIKPSNLVFLIDTSGSMGAENKLPLLKHSFKQLVSNLSPQDKVAIVAYAGSAGLVLPSTPASEKNTIINALDRLSSGGSTAGGAGIELAYTIATNNLIENGNNRVILATDGDFNVGASSRADLVDLIQKKSQSSIFLTICGFGMGNYKDGSMEQMSNMGNGNYFYIDSLKEAKKVFVDQMRSSMFTIAKDVKIQIEFNPLVVQSYHLIGYENRMLNKEDFNNDSKDAGELGAGHTVTALYEIIPARSKESLQQTDPLKYQKMDLTAAAHHSNQIMTIKLRYKRPKEIKSNLIVKEVTDTVMRSPSDNLQFSTAVAGYGLLVRDSQYKGTLNWEQIIQMAKASKGNDEMGYRADFISLAETTKMLHENKLKN